MISLGFALKRNKSHYVFASICRIIDSGSLRIIYMKLKIASYKITPRQLKAVV